MTTRALVLRAPGINCDRETAHACRLAGFATDLVHINALVRDEEQERDTGRARPPSPYLLDYHLFVIPGGFSYGDDLGAGTLLAKKLMTHLGGQLEQFIAEGRLVLGICNGFQVLVRAGLLDLLPGTIGTVSEQTGDGLTVVASLTDNRSAQFECRWVTLSIETNICLFTQYIKRPIELPVAHGEGQLILANPALIEQLEMQGQIPLKYSVRAQGIALTEGRESSALPLSEVTVAYPHNPNGSMSNIAGMCNAQGNVFGLMPHPERYVSALQHPQRCGDAYGEGDGLLIFKNAYSYAKTLNKQGSPSMG